MKKRRNRETAMMVLIGIQALGLFWQLAGSLIYQSHLIPLLGMTAHIMTIIGFEAGFRREQRLAGGTEDEALDFRRAFYRISVWLVTLFPLSGLTRIFWVLYNGSYNSTLALLSPLILYFPLCLAVTAALRPKKARGSR